MRFWWVWMLLFVMAPCASGHPPLLILYPQQLQFPAPFTISPTPTRQVFIIQNGTHGDMEWTSQITTASGGNWLSLSPSAAMLPDSDLPSSMNTYVSVSATGLKPGVYTGTITITASRLYQGVVYAAVDSPQSVAVTYTVFENSVPSVKVTSNALSLQGVAGIGMTASAAVGISNAGPGTLAWTAAAQTSSTVAWLDVSPGSGTNAGNITISANPGRLAAGTYTGMVNVTAPGSPTATVAVTYTVRAPTPAQIQLPTQTLNFSLPQSSGVSTQALSVANPGESVLNWRTSAVTLNGGDWLSVSPGIGTNNGTITVTANTAALAMGIYVGRLTISADGAANSPTQVQVNLTVRRGTPNIAGGGFYNAASLSPDGVVAGSLASIFGAHLGPDAGISFTPTAQTPGPPVTLAGTRVTVDGVAAPLFYVSNNQINLQIPVESAGKSTVTAHIEADGYDPADFKVTLSPASIGIFSLDGVRAAAINQNGTLNTASPAPVGSIVQFYATGQGVVDVPVATGAAAPQQAPFPAPTIPITMQIGGLPAKIVFAGLAPGMVGMLQMNVIVPANVTPGDLTLVQTQSGSGKPSIVYISTGPALDASSSP